METQMKTNINILNEIFSQENAQSLISGYPQNGYSIFEEYVQKSGESESLLSDKNAFKKFNKELREYLLTQKRSLLVSAKVPKIETSAVTQEDLKASKKIGSSLSTTATFGSSGNSKNEV
jgi:hypothetical protein